MGGVDSKMSGDKPTAVVSPMPTTNINETLNALEKEAEEEQNRQLIEEQVAEEQDITRTNVTLQLFQYRQQMSLKNHQIVKWASSKLLLTEELLKQQQKEIERLREQQEEKRRLERRRHRRKQPLLSMPILDESDAQWAERQLALLADDNDDDDDDDDLEDDFVVDYAEQHNNTENQSPNEDPLCTEHSRLMNYRLQLRNTILEVAQEKLRRREKTKLKRLKRRTLISSKKPSKKGKYKSNQYQDNQYEDSPFDDSQYEESQYQDSQWIKTMHRQL